MMSEVATADPALKDRVKRDDRAHVFHTWSAQAEIDPLPVAGAQGSYFFDYDGKRYLDFASQLVYSNLGHGHPRLVQAIKAQADKLPVIAPAFANEVRSEAARAIAEVAGGHFAKVFFTNGGADANEHAIRMARLHTGRVKVMSFYRSYHGATSGAIALTGDPRRWANEATAMSHVAHFWGPYPYRSPFYASSPEQETERALQHLRNVLMVEGPETVAAIIMETVVGTNGILVPPPGYLAGVRQVCDEYGIVMIADEVMAGFGRCGHWFGVQHWGVQPDLITFAKGVTSGYVPLGGVVISDAIASTFDHRAYPGGLTYSGHLLACAVAIESIKTLREENVLEHVRSLGQDVIGPGLQALADKHPSVGEVRGLGVFWAIELVKDRNTREPLVPFNAKGEAARPMNEFKQVCMDNGLSPFVHFNRTHVSPPCTATADEIRQGLEILDEALSAADKHYVG
ncbi:MAG: aspartate aminotransferase family protein [Candidatus Cloacimonetes bacterium]|nr:aspartate aminotransferase family protein [Candidatus Cloacimonadota bacterium]